MDPVDVVSLTRALVDIDSTTGREGEACAWLARYLRGRGYEVLEQPVDGARVNLLATDGSEPSLVLSTHLDCVPPFLPSRVEDGRIHGRGSCDAKGIAAAQIAAAERLRDAGVRHVGLLFVVGEERGSDGAAAANPLARGCRFLVNGEPTDCRLARATRGVLRLRLHAEGRAAHSSFPELGVSAVDGLVDALVALRAFDLPEHPVLGKTHYTVGLISGGVAPNVVPPWATAEVMFRTVGPGGDVRRSIAALEARVTIEHVLEVPPVEMHVVDGFTTEVFPFTTDVPLLDRWGTPLLYGPGSIHVAHTAHEWVSIAELEAAIDGYASIARRLLATS
jgi:acetylornithine deacetylase